MELQPGIPQEVFPFRIPLPAGISFGFAGDTQGRNLAEAEQPRRAQGREFGLGMTLGKRQLGTAGAGTAGAGTFGCQGWFY